VGAHRALWEAGYEPAAIGGCSVGAALGALWAAGLTPEEIKQATSRARWRRFVSPFGGRLGLFSLRKLGKRVEQLCGVKRIEDLPVPLSIHATDLSTGEPAVLREGPLGQSVAASCAIPGVFAPVKVEGRTLVDGGVTQNLPMTILDGNRALRFVLAVDPIRKLELTAKPRNALTAVLQAFLIQLRTQSAGAHKECRKPVIVATPETAGINVLSLRQLSRLDKAGYEEMQRMLRDNRRWFEKGPPRGRKREAAKG
jgi:NTE family protein